MRWQSLLVGARLVGVRDSRLRWQCDGSRCDGRGSTKSSSNSPTALLLLARTLECCLQPLPVVLDGGLLRLRVVCQPSNATMVLSLKHCDSQISQA